MRTRRSPSWSGSPSAPTSSWPSSPTGWCAASRTAARELPGAVVLDLDEVLGELVDGLLGAGRGPGQGARGGILVAVAGLHQHADGERQHDTPPARLADPVRRVRSEEQEAPPECRLVGGSVTDLIGRGQPAS